MIPRVSIIVPVYNVAAYVGACLRSIANQSLSAFEVIVVDDGSTDGSGEIARAAVAGDGRFDFVHQENAGLSAARNAGLERAMAPYIAFVDSDDRIAPEYLERLVGTLEESGADWVSCGIRFLPTDGEPVDHTAIHSTLTSEWKIQGGLPPERHDFTDWQEVARHFPSAWNKLYRGEILGDMRFDPGMLYEDHAFYWRYAARTDHLLRLPEPLYFSTQGRPGQITRDGSDAVFQQFDVLEILETVSAQTPKIGREAALAQIATRLTLERAEAVNDRARWKRFVQASRDWLDARGITPDLRLGVPPWWADALAGRIAVSVVVPTDGQAAPLQATLDSLHAQTCRASEVLVVPDEAVTGEARTALYTQAGALPGASVLAGASGVHGARNRGLAAARGNAVVFLDAGDRLPPRALGVWHTRLRRAGAQMGFAPMRMGEGPHTGMHDHSIPADLLACESGFAPRSGDALALHGHPAAKIFDRAFLLREKISFPEGALSSTHLLARVCAVADRLVRLEAPAPRIGLDKGARQLWRQPLPADALHKALVAMQAEGDMGLPEGWQTRLWARLVWEKMNHAAYGAGQAAFEADVARLSVGLQQPGVAGLDPYIGQRVRRVIGLPADMPT